MDMLYTSLSNEKSKFAHLLKNLNIKFRVESTLLSISNRGTTLFMNTRPTITLSKTEIDHGKISIA